MSKYLIKERKSHTTSETSSPEKQIERVTTVVPPIGYDGWNSFEVVLLGYILL
jgi:hypothetical protein